MDEVIDILNKNKKLTFQYTETVNGNRYDRVYIKTPDGTWGMKAILLSCFSNNKGV
jgi:hypothetical protein